MVYALAQPAACAGLILALAMGITIRVLAQTGAQHVLYRINRPGGARPRARRDIHPLGILAAVIGGTGFGTAGPALPSRQRSMPAVAVHMAGPVAVIATSQLLLAGYAAGTGRQSLSIYLPSDVLRGAPAIDGGTWRQLWFSTAVALLCFGITAALPVPPADGWNAMTTAGKRTPPARLHDALVNRNIGAFIVMVTLIVPIAGTPPLHLLLDALGAPLIRIWSGALRCRGAS